ncbi:MAM and LDL-receptor class A domain-containing protein 1 isoform X2 [Lepeophtheirus salmonis]|uniref:MAM domain-containing protein n=1 Tax=Lepeophtheirus salmonis TaxID=72036 RepID=A0A0K2UTB1_LEPSM|nr:MAM and LDL-receptor class A domain-containing protein 1-like isoform X2 [Lepeophtheirus salmonis]
MKQNIPLKLFIIIINASFCFGSPSNFLVDSPRARVKRQFSLKDKFTTRKPNDDYPDGVAGEDAKCNFGQGDSISLCKWVNINLTEFKFEVSNGINSHWIGGPPRDDSEKNEKGGYAFFETSQLSEQKEGSITQSAMLKSPTFKSTNADGHCISFSYFIDGLSAESLRILLHPVKKVVKEEIEINSNSTDVKVQSLKFDEVIDFQKNTIISTMRDSTRGLWKNGKVLYSYPGSHKIVFEAIPKDETDQGRRFRGFIAIDEIKFMSGDKCSGHCSFDAGFCGFTNAEKADFDWMVSRGSSNPNTGPIRDHSSFSTNKVTGSFAYINAGYPRRPGDKAHLISEEFPPTFKNDPHCLRFWTHMYGSGVGELNVYIIVNDKWSKVWSLSGDAGNNWYMGQTPISAKTPFKIAFEGIVGRNELGNIALDDVTISPGVCPTFPQVAGAQVGDCTFEDDTCNWKNPEIGESVYDELDWERLDASTGPTSRYPTYDHTTGSRGGYFISLSRKGVQKAGDRAHFVSNEMKGTSEPICMSFWYFMYEPIIDKAGPNLGKLSVLIKSFDKNDNTVITPIWRLHNGKGPSWEYGQVKIESEKNFEVVFEGVWGNNRVSGFIALDDLTFYKGDCDSLPKRASLIKAECTFDRDACGWRNTSTGDFEWRLATLARRPANLPDKSFGAPVGYAYFDIFNTGSKANSVRMSSPTILKKEITTDEVCFSFWYAAFGAGDTTSLKVLQKITKSDDNEKKNDEESNDESDPIWSISAADLNTARPEWMAGQVSIKVNEDFKIIFVGKASNGGFAIDHLIFNPGPCSRAKKLKDKMDN